MDRSLKTTEERNSASIHIDRMSTRDIVAIINREDEKVPKAVESASNEICHVIDMVTERLLAGGRLFYVGAGTSGRLGVLDASECPPTYGVSKNMVIGIIAGGEYALRNSIEGAEDDTEAGIEDLKAYDITEKDSVIGITANGGAPYVYSALEYAKSVGSYVAAICSNVDSAVFSLLDSNSRIYLPVGPEIITGSTRMKSGTAQKLTLNLISTVSMIKLGKVYNNLMVDLVPVNAKLVERSLNMIQEITGVDREEAARCFEESGSNTKRAIVMAAMDIDRGEAEKLLEKECVLSRLFIEYGAKRLSQEFR